MTYEEVVKDIRKSANKLNQLRSGVDPGHVQIEIYLRKLEKKLREQADELERRCNRESGS